MLYSWSSPALTERKLMPWSSGGPDCSLLTRRVMEADTWGGLEEMGEELEEPVRLMSWIS